MMIPFSRRLVARSFCLRLIAAVGIFSATQALANEDKSASTGASAAAIVAKNIEQFLADLSSTDYRTREDATRQLSKAGSEAVGEVGRVAGGEDLEAAFRAVRILQAMVVSDDEILESQALAALEQLAARGASSTKDLAIDALEVHHLARQERTIARLRQLCAEVIVSGTELSSIEIPITGGSFLAVTISASKWRGSPADFALLKQLPNLYQVRIYGVPVDDKSADALAALKPPGYISLFGTGISDSAHAMLLEKFPPPNTTIDRRGSAFLGVGGTFDPTVNGCEVTKVVPNSPADQVGLLPGDKILSVDGQPLQAFSDLTSLIGKKEAGESATLQIRRGNDELAKTVKFANWQ
ncbi:MAG: PDZ domain-containing protein [Pirellulales bacterium]|nr:PDZ domain-containing protein [Pirellulales bacterium]